MLISCSTRTEKPTFHFDFAKFFFICALTEAWMFLSRAVLPDILKDNLAFIIAIIATMLSINE